MIKNKNTLKSQNTTLIKDNNNREITEAILREHLGDVIDSYPTLMDTNSFEAIQSYDDEYTFTLDNEIVSKKYVDDAIGAIPVEEKVISITYNSLATLRNGNTLVPGQLYLITDFQNMTFLGGTSNINVGDIEQIIVRSLSTNMFERTIKSVQRPQDILYYNFDNRILADTEYILNGFLSGGGDFEVAVINSKSFSIASSLAFDNNLIISINDGNITAEYNMNNTTDFYVEFINENLNIIHILNPSTIDLNKSSTIIEVYTSMYIFNRPGLIERRIDTVKQIDTTFDFLSCKVRMYKLNYTSKEFTPMNSYAKGEPVFYDNTIYFSLSDVNTVNNVNISTKWLNSSISTNLYFIKNIDLFIFDSWGILYNDNDYLDSLIINWYNCYNFKVITQSYDNNNIQFDSSNNSIINDISNSQITNINNVNITKECDNSYVYNFMYSNANIITSSFITDFSNTNINSCNNYNGFFNKVESISHNFINCVANINECIFKVDAVDCYMYRCIYNNFEINMITGLHSYSLAFNNNIIKGVFDLIINENSEFLYNELCNINSCIIPVHIVVRYINATTDLIGINFTGATIVSGDYNKTIFKNSNGELRMSYYDSLDNIVVETNITL
jgi:hypothetical protein